MKENNINMKRFVCVFLFAFIAFIGFSKDFDKDTTDCKKYENSENTEQKYIAVVFRLKVQAGSLFEPGTECSENGIHMSLTNLINEMYIAGYELNRIVPIEETSYRVGANYTGDLILIFKRYSD